jgi:hypothetical protein
MARHTQLEMADIDLREVDGVFSDGEYTRARPLSPPTPGPKRRDATTDELHPCCPVQAVWSALRWPRAREACGGV